MGLREEITKEIASAVKAGDKLRLSTLRLLLAAVKNKEIELRKELSDEGVHKVASTLSRQRRDSIEQFKKGGRFDLADKEEEELEILKAFMPPQLSTDEIMEIVKKAVSETGATGVKDMGKVMKAVMAELKGKAEGKTVQQVVKEFLGGQ
jgi:uncharacterized protein YqeY